METTPVIVKCSCSTCSQHLEFESHQAGTIVTCPSCGRGTVLYDPAVRASIESLALIPQAIPLAAMPLATGNRNKRDRKIEAHKKRILGSKICTNCGGVEQDTFTRGSLGVEIFLWILLLIPGLLYSAWRLHSRYQGCSACGSKELLPVSMPKGRELLAKYYPDEFEMVRDFNLPDSKIRGFFTATTAILSRLVLAGLILLLGLIAFFAVAMVLN